MNKIDFTFTVLKQIHLEPLALTPVARPAQFSASTLSRINAKAWGGGTCDWIHQIWQWVLRLFGCSSSPSSATSSTTQPLTQGPIGPTTIDATQLADRINRGNQIIDGLFRSPFILNANAPHSAIMVVMKYNNRCKVQMGRAADVRNAIPMTKNMLQQMLTSESSRHANQPGAHTLSLNIYRFDKGASFAYQHNNHWINFINENTGEGSGQNAGFGVRTLNGLLAVDLPEPHLTQASNYLINEL